MVVYHKNSSIVPVTKIIINTFVDRIPIMILSIRRVGTDFNFSSTIRYSKNIMSYLTDMKNITLGNQIIII